MNKQQKVLAAVLGVGVLALGADRLVFESPATGPQAAEAQAEFAAESDADQPKDEATAVAEEALEAADERAEPSPSLAERLDEAGQRQNLPERPSRDAFAPSEAWMTAIAPTPEADPTADADANVRRFRENHQLMAVMTPGDRGVVVVNNRAMRVGQRINGFTLIAVDHHSATFLGEDGEAVLQLDR